MVKKRKKLNSAEDVKKKTEDVAVILVLEVVHTLADIMVDLADIQAVVELQEDSKT